MSINFSELKRSKIRKRFDNGIEVYNPSPKQKEKIIKLISENIDNETDKIEISGKDVLLQLIPELTNIKLDLKDDDKLVDEILEDPSQELTETVNEITDIIQFLSNQMMTNINNMSKLPKEKLDEIIQYNNI